MTISGEVILAALGFLGGIGVAVVKGLFNRRRSNVDVESVQVQNALAVVEPLHRVIASLEVRLGAMGLEVDAISKENDRLSKALADVQRENLILQNELLHAKADLGKLQRSEKTSLVERTEAAVRIRDAGIDVPLPTTRGERTREGDHEEDVA